MLLLLPSIRIVELPPVFENFSMLKRVIPERSANKNKNNYHQYLQYVKNIFHIFIY